MDLEERLIGDMKAAMKAGAKLKVSTVRMIMSEIKNAEIAKRDLLSNEETLDVVAREAKKRKEAIAEFEKGGRADLVEKETAELAYIQEYLPEQLSTEDVGRIIRETIEEVGAKGPGDLGAVMSKIMPSFKGRADGKTVNAEVRRALEQL